MATIEQKKTIQNLVLKYKPVVIQNGGFTKIKSYVL